MMDWLFQNTPLYLMTQSLWSDEGFSYLISRLPLNLLIQRAAEDFNPPLYYVILHFWMKMFGTNEVIMRSLSMLFLVITAYIFSLFLEHVFKIKGKRNFVYSILFLFNPFLLYYGFEVRMYSLFALVSLLSYYLLVRKNYRWYSLSILLGLYSHYFFVCVVATQLIYIYLVERSKLRKIARLFIAPFVLFLPWLMYSMPKIIPQLTTTWVQPMNIIKLISTFGTLFTGYEPDYWSYYHLPNLIISVVVLSMVFGIAMHASKTKKTDKTLILLFLWSFFFYVLVGLVSFVRPLFVPRYLIFAPIGFMFLVVYFLEKLDLKKTTITIVLIALVMAHYYHAQSGEKRKGDIRATVKQIQTLSDNSDLIYVPDASSYFTASYYFGEARVFVYAPADTIPYYIGLSLIPKDKIKLDLPVYPQKAFVLRGANNYQVLTVQ